MCWNDTFSVFRRQKLGGGQTDLKINLDETKNGIYLADHWGELTKTAE